MAKQRVQLEFQGYWQEIRMKEIPNSSGIFCVYESRLSLASGSVKPEKLLYIGEADDVRKRIAGHEKMSKWKAQLGGGNKLCFSFAPVEADVRKQVAAAMIFKFKPPVNTTHKMFFQFDRTIVIISGKADLLNPYFTIHRTK